MLLSSWWRGRFGTASSRPCWTTGRRRAPASTSITQAVGRRRSPCGCSSTYCESCVRWASDRTGTEDDIQAGLSVDDWKARTATGDNVKAQLRAERLTACRYVWSYCTGRLGWLIRSSSQEGEPWGI